MNLYGNVSDEKAIAGLLYGMNPKTIVSAPAQESINYGKGVFYNGDKTALLNGKHSNTAVIDLSAYTTASKDIVLTVNGTAIEATTTGTIATDVATILEDVNEISGVSATSASNKITVTSDNESELTITLSYDGSDVTSTKVTTSSTATYAGVSVFHQNAFDHSRGHYVATESVALMEKGYVWVELATGVSPSIGSTAYVTKAGTFTTSSSGNTEVGVFKSSAETGASRNIALVSLD